MTTDASVYRLVDDLRMAHEDLRSDLLKICQVADAMYSSLAQAFDAGVMPEHAAVCSCNLCAAISEYKVIKWKMTQ